MLVHAGVSLSAPPMSHSLSVSPQTNCQSNQRLELDHADESMAPLSGSPLVVEDLSTDAKATRSNKLPVPALHKDKVAKRKRNTKVLVKPASNKRAKSSRASSGTTNSGSNGNTETNLITISEGTQTQSEDLNNSICTCSCYLKWSRKGCALNVSNESKVGELRDSLSMLELQIVSNLKELKGKIDALFDELSKMKSLIISPTVSGGSSLAYQEVDNCNPVSNPSAAERGVTLVQSCSKIARGKSKKEGYDGIRKRDHCGQNPAALSSVEENCTSPFIAAKEVITLPVINLPPESAGYTIVMAGVPTLKSDRGESYSELKNKTMYWLNKHRPLPPQAQGEIIMVRRVNWVGKRKKEIEGDCILVNFRDTRVVRHIIGWGNLETTAGIARFH